MKNSLKLFFSIATSLFLGSFTFAQSNDVALPSPELRSLMLFEDNRVSLQTGIPDISLPIFSLPTYSSFVNANVIMAYHPSDVRFGNSGGNVGNGWNVFTGGGVVTRKIIGTVDQYNSSSTFDDIYQFSFGGKLGKFLIKNVNGNLTPVVVSNSDETFKIELINPSSTAPFFTGFTIFDNKGIKYIFNITDQSVTTSATNFIYKSAYHLSTVFDANNNLLLNIQYTNTTGGTITRPTNENRISSITSTGHGILEFVYTNLKLSSVIMKDTYSQNKQIAEFNTSQLIIKSPQNQIIDSYKFTYNNLYPLESIDYDVFGYPVGVDCPLDLAPNVRDFAQNGLLQSIENYTGGVKYYAFETNQFSKYTTRTIPPQTPEGHTFFELIPDVNPESYRDEEYDHSYNYEFFANQLFLSSLHSLNFTLTTNETLAILAQSTSYTVSSAPLTDANGDFYNITHTPEFKLYYRPNSSTAWQLLQGIDRNAKNLGYCYGQEFQLSAGQYRIEIVAHAVGHPCNGEVTIHKKVANPQQPNRMFGGGVRIKETASFKNTTELNSFLSSGQLLRNFSGAENVTLYDYNFSSGEFAGMSSGVFMLGDLNNVDNVEAFYDRNLVDYREVTVITPGLGKKEYTMQVLTTYLSNISNFATGDAYDFRRGLISKIRTFNEAGFLEVEQNMTYNYNEDTSLTSSVSAFNILSGWTSIATQNTKRYFQGITNPVVENQTFTYNANNRQPESVTITDLGSNETTLEQYFYHTGNSIHQQNRVTFLEEKRTTVNGNLTATEKITYANTFSSNVSFLPSLVQKSKATAPLYTESEVLRYDEFGHPIETRQPGGITTCYIYGYNKTVVVAKIENFTYSAIPNSRITTLQNATNIANNNAAVLTAINALINDPALAAAFVTGYVYEPLVGIRTMIDSKGDFFNFSYFNNDSNRLSQVTDQDGNILKSYSYVFHTSSEGVTVTETIYKQPTTVVLTNPTQTQADVVVRHYDSWSRLDQTRMIKGSTDSKDLVQIVKFDNYGRTPKTFLPHVESTSLSFNPNSESQQSTFYSSLSGSLPSNSFPFYETVFDANLESTVLEQSAPGLDWSLQSNIKHTVRTTLSTNITSDQVRKITVNVTNTTTIGAAFTASLNQQGLFPENSLIKIVTRNENWVTNDGELNTSVSFYNQAGKLLVSRTFLPPLPGTTVCQKVDTYYVYDDFGNLSFVIPPNVDVNLTITPEVLNNLCYQYRYDYRNNLVEKRIPGKDWEYMLYDRLNRIAAIGPVSNPFSGDSKGWLHTKYDPMNRVALTAFSTATINSTTRTSRQGAFYNTAASASERKTTTFTTINNVGSYYTNNTWPTTGHHIISINYYDDYTIQPNFTVAETITVEGVSNFYNNTTRQPKGLPTANWTRICDSQSGNSGVLTYQYYTKKGFILAKRSVGAISGRSASQDVTLNAFTGQINAIRSSFTKDASATTLTVTDRITYNNQSRITRVTHQINDLPEELMSAPIYNDLGAVESKLVGGQLGQAYYQKIDYRYNQRGWLSEINQINNLHPNNSSEPRDLFAFSIRYQDNASALGYPAAGVVEKQYNGNVSEIYWRGGTDNVLRKYSFVYDDKDRITNAIYQQPNATNPIRNSYNESVTYDKVGNITSVYRTGEFDDPSLVHPIDDLQYTYAPNSNRLMKVSDQAQDSFGFIDDAPQADTADDYAYDPITGSLTRDDNKNISSIAYNHLDQPLRIVFSTGENISYIYDGQGNKVEKRTTSAQGVTTLHEYWNGLQYQNGILQFFPTPEGYVTHLVSNNQSVFKYVYHYKDHLGNVRLSYTNAAASGAPNLQILAYDGLYPYGLTHKNYGATRRAWEALQASIVINPLNASINDEAPGNYKYLFNGQEFQEDISENNYAMTFRAYDPALGRFTGVDLLAELQYEHTPYHFGYGNPNVFADPSGLFGSRRAARRYRRENGVTGRIQKLDNGTFVIVRADGSYIVGNDSDESGSSGDDAGSESDNIFFFFGGGDSGFGGGIGSSGVSGGGGNATGGVGDRLWDLNKDGKLQKTEADFWWLFGRGRTIYVDNNKIDWTGLKVPGNKKTGRFKINTTAAFIYLPFETAATYGGTSFEIIDSNTVKVVDQLYHYNMRSYNSIENIKRNVLTQLGKPFGPDFLNLIEGSDYTIHYLNPTIKLK
ncbi:DUF6443 domain-containing protein [Flavobacterium sp.]|uniref:DUF6443 domain-containing protein n=1 Tax=Flavobacterium sp. TaxID=239 RepID=UPI003B9C8FEE